MLILTNPGSNLGPELVARYDVALTPQKIVVDGTEHDTRGEVDFARIDTWVKTAKEHPYVLGTSAAEFISAFTELAQRDPQILTVTTSRKIIHSHDSAVAAVRTLEKRGTPLDVRVADSGFTDLGAGLAVTLAGEAMRAGRTLDEITTLLDAYREQARFTLVADTLEYLVKGGRATPIRAMLANLLGLRPLISMVEGEISIDAKISASADRAEAIAKHLETAIGAGRPVWIGVFHGNAPARATALAESLEKRFRVVHRAIRPLSPSIYLHMGPGAVGAVVVPVDRLPFPVRAPE